MSNLALIRDTRCLHGEDEMTKISPSNGWGQKKCWDLAEWPCGLMPDEGVS
jgi:hypothetical protein